jgi:type I site-specific restriction endonuclease
MNSASDGDRLAAGGTGMDLTKFKDKARLFLKAHDSHISLQRLRRNQPLTPSDLTEFEHMLEQAGGTQALIDQARRREPWPGDLYPLAGWPGP